MLAEWNDDAPAAPQNVGLLSLTKPLNIHNSKTIRLNFDFYESK